MLCCVEAWCVFMGISCACALWSLIFIRGRNWATIPTHGIVVCVGVVCRSSTPPPIQNHLSWSVQSIALLCTSDQRHAHVCAHVHSHSSVVMLCWPCFDSISVAGSVTVCVNMRLHFCLCDFGVKTRLTVLFVFGGFLRNKLLLSSWVEIQ